MAMLEPKKNHNLEQFWPLTSKSDHTFHAKNVFLIATLIAYM